MRKLNLVLLFCFVSISSLLAQDLDNSGKYLYTIESIHNKIDQHYMGYMSAASHGRRAKNVENLRLQIVDSINVAKNKLLDFPLYNGDNSLKQLNIDYINSCYTIFKEDYAKVVKAEEFAEHSIDEMQTYLLMKEKVDKKLQDATDKLHKGTEAFVARYNVVLVEVEKSKLAKKVEIAGKANKYYKPIHLIFFKCNWQDEALYKILYEYRITNAEQARIAVIKYAEEGLLALKSIQPYEGGDSSLIEACKQVLLVYKDIAEKETLVMIDYLLKKENFGKIKKAFEAKPQADRTKEDVAVYNKAIEEFNTAINQSNQAAAKGNIKRTEGFKIWENTVKVFFDKYTSRYN